MKAGIIAEGRGDAAVITNLLKGKLNIQKSDIDYRSPELDSDETDLSQMKPEQFSTWSIVRQKCMDTEFLRNFFEKIDDERFLVVHLDAAERLEVNYEVSEPLKSKLPDYVVQVCQNIAAKISEWMQGQYANRVAYAIAVEETDAWVLTIFSKKETDTGYLENPKERLQRELNKPNFMSKRDRGKLFSKLVFDHYSQLSDPFRKPKELEKLIARNASLRLFCEDLNKFKFNDSDNQTLR